MYVCHLLNSARSYYYQLLNLSRKVGHLEHKLNDYQRVVMLLSQKKIAGVARLLSVALRNGASARAIYDRLQGSITHTYAPKGNWTEHEFDVAFLIKALGGPRLLYVLQKEEGYPSLSTLRRQRHIPEIIVSTGMPAYAEFDANITAFLGTGRRQPPLNPEIGQVLMMDGVALEEACRFDLKRNCILGLCREHAGQTKLTVDDANDIDRVSKALFQDQSIHHGKDGTVVGIAPITGKKDYFPAPLVLSASCKTEKGSDMAKWIPEFLESYRNNPDGARRHGPIYTVATDGESSFRNLRFQIGLTELLSPTSSMGQIIYQLSGMNCRTGANGLLTTCDPKHIIKRFATMIRSPSGIQIGESHISTGMIRDALLQLDSMPPQKVDQLLHPADKQNVPKAVNLLQSLHDLREKEHTLNPSIKHRIRQVVFLSKALGFFLFPFIDVQMSLSEQICNLSAYTHIMTAMYRRHRTSFLTSALFADSQAIVKNIFFTIARLQTLNPSLEYFILFEGTDRLEGVFSNVRTQDHARNFDILQLAQKLSIGAEINAVFQRNPDLDRGHIRRNLVNLRGLDHINPASWKGDAVVGHVDIVMEYLRGRDVANDLLVEYFGEPARVNFNTLFSPSAASAPKIDHLRPFGRYIGSRAEVDEDNLPVPAADDDVNDDDDDSENLSDSLASDAISGARTSVHQEESDIRDLRDAVDTPNASMLDVGPGDEINPMTTSDVDKKPHRITYNGMDEYKPSLIARLLSSEAGKKVTTRTLRARGLALIDALQSRLESLNQSSKQENDEDLIKSGDLGAFFVRVGDSICLAAAEIMSFQKGSSKISLSAVNFDDLEISGSNAVTVTVQVMELKSAGVVPNSSWIWPSSQRFIRVQGKKDGTQLQRDFVLQIPGSDFHPLGPSIVEESGTTTWSIQDDDMRAVFEHASSLTQIVANRAQTIANIQRLPIVLEDSGLPYKLDADSTPQFCLSLDSDIRLPTGRKDGDDIISCHICQKSLPLKDMRNHVGQHILLSLRSCEDKNATQEIGVNPCGWCGLDGMCRTQLTEAGTSISITSDCDYHYARMAYKRALVPSKRSPCTNVPLICPLCTPNEEIGTFWKYNLLFHMAAHHLQDDEEFPPFPRQLIVQSHITKAEERELGVDEIHTGGWRDHSGWWNSDAIEAMESDKSYKLRHRKRTGSEALSDVSTSSARGASPTKRSHLTTH